MLVVCGFLVFVVVLDEVAVFREEAVVEDFCVRVSEDMFCFWEVESYFGLSAVEDSAGICTLYGVVVLVLVLHVVGHVDDVSYFDFLQFCLDKQTCSWHRSSLLRSKV